MIGNPVRKVLYQSVFKGLFSAFALLVLYFSVVTLISGRQFAQDQFLEFWYFVLALASGFGIQVGLYTYLKSSLGGKNQKAYVLAASGTTSTAAMISCCSHYLVNLLPILGVAGIVTIISQYQLQLFWVGLTFNFAGILYMTKKVYQFSKIHEVN